eukprot:3341084-Rhodomonas_salina.2
MSAQQAGARQVGREHWEGGSAASLSYPRIRSGPAEAAQRSSVLYSLEACSTLSSHKICL